MSDLSKVNIISATEARNRWFELIELVWRKGKRVVVKRREKPILEIRPISEGEEKKYKDILESLDGILPAPKKPLADIVSEAKESYFGKKK